MNMIHFGRHRSGVAALCFVAAFAAGATSLASAGPVSATTANRAPRAPTTSNDCARTYSESTIARHTSAGDPQECFVARAQKLLPCFSSAQARTRWQRYPVGDPQTCYMELAAASPSAG